MEMMVIGIDKSEAPVSRSLVKSCVSLLIETRHSDLANAN
jgi:hypothetical protein